MRGLAVVELVQETRDMEVGSLPPAAPAERDDHAARAAGWPGWRTAAGAAALYGAVVALVARKLLAGFGSVLPATLVDPLQHLWILRWYRACLLAGRSPFFCPDVQFPVGSPLGLYSPLHLQALLFLPLSFLVPADATLYNLLWLAGLALTAAGGFALVWHVLRDRAAAVFGGLLALLATPILLHAHAHLELMYAGSFPLFLVAWMRFVDRPGGHRLAAALALYAFLAMSAAYFAVLAVVPAILYVLTSTAAPGRGGKRWIPSAARSGVRGLISAAARGGVRERLPWLAAFAVVAVVLLALLFLPQLWARAHGFSVVRPKAEFDRYGAPLWAWFVPTWIHRAGALWPVSPYTAAGYGKTAVELASYLGVVPIFLLGWAAVRRVRFPRAAFWWTCFALLAALSLGSYWYIGDLAIPLPADGLWHLFPPIRETRVPARFNLLALFCAALLASAGLADLLSRLRRPLARAGAYAACVALVALDLVPRPFPTVRIPATPPGYAAVLARDPAATFLEVPHFGSQGTHLSAETAYWQSRHGGRTSGGYSGHVNPRFENLLTFNSPFWARRLAVPSYLEDPGDEIFDLVRAGFYDYAWLYLREHGFRYVVLHRRPQAAPELPVRLERLEALLAPARVYADGATAIYAAARLPPPRHPVLLCREGFRRRSILDERWNAPVSKSARLVLYSPEPAELRLAFGAVAFRHARVVRLLAEEASGTREVARFHISTDTYRWYVTAPLALPRGTTRLRLESDGEERPRLPEEAVSEGDDGPYSLRMAAIELRPPEAVSVPSGS